MSSTRKRLSWGIALGVAVTGLVAPAASANPAGTGLVISEVYVNGGSANAAYTHKFVELYNPTAAAVDLSTMSVQYRSPTGTGKASTAVALTGTIPAKGYFVLQGGSNGTNGAAVPSPNQTSGLNPGGSGGTVFLASATEALDPDPADAAGAVVDLVGWGTSNAPETLPATGNTVEHSLQRKTVDGVVNVDTDNNKVDFAPAAPTPSGGGGEPEPTPDPVAKTIPEIQGTGTASPLKGTAVITEGVVTAAYPTGGLNGFYIQTPGTGATDLDLATRTASDGLFVYQEFAARPVTVAPGDHVRVTGTVDEYSGLTQVKVVATADIEKLTTPGAPVVPTTTSTWPGTAAEKELLEGMLYRPTGDFTVTNTFSTNQYGEVGLAQGDKPLIQPTQVEDAQTGAVDAIAADNAARAIVLDDASSTNFTATSSKAADCGAVPTPCLVNGALTPPYISNEKPVRVGAAATFTSPVIFAEGGSASAPTYRFQPLAPVTGPDNATSPATFENTRTEAPDAAQIDPEGKAEVKVASFNVLNYFTTLGDANDDNVPDAGCTFYADRAGDGVTVNSGDGCPRGAWDPQDLKRQQTKIVEAINALDADVVGLMEIENSAVVDGIANADEATKTLVAALNADAGSTVWAANPSSSELPGVEQMDVISSAIIYKPAVVERVGEARALGTESASGGAFDNAREPIAQAFASVKGGEPFLFVVNHFKSKGSGVDDKTGQGNANPDRIRQATALSAWIPTVQSATGADAVLLVGDFNSYAMEDPLQVLYEAGYANAETKLGGDEYSYSFSGLSGSLDHVLANPAAMGQATGIDIWNINSGESLAMEYSRHNYHGTDFYEPTPFRSSDHDPVVLGLDLAPNAAEVVKVGSTTSVKLLQRKVVQRRTRAQLRIRVRADGVVPTGQVRVHVSGKGTRTVTLRQGQALVRLTRFTGTGRKRVTVTYLGDSAVEASRTRYSFRVVRK